MTKVTANTGNLKCVIGIAVRCNSLRFSKIRYFVTATGTTKGLISAGFESRFTSLLRAAKHYESCFDDAIDRLIPMLEPAMMVILGGLVGVLMLAMYLPLFQIGSVLG